MTSSKRKPYLGKKKSLREFFAEPVRHLKESNEKESAFEKPYLTTEYPLMHLELPEVDWPTWRFDPTRVRPTRREVLGTGRGCKACDLSSYALAASDCEADAVNFHSRLRCVKRIPGSYAPPESRKLEKGGYLQQWGSTTITVAALLGEIKEILPGPFASLFPDVDVYVNENIADHVLLATMVDDLGNTCSELVEVTCAVCPPETAFSFDDDSTPDSIAPGGTITVYVLGGSPPFSWDNAGTGYSWGGGSSTTARENDLSCATGT